MKTQLVGAACAFALVLAASSVFAADKDAMKSDMGMSPKMEKSPSEMKDGKLYTVQCGSPCDFEVKSHDKQEVIALTLNHVKTHHNMTNATEKDVEAMVKVVEPKM